MKKRWLIILAAVLGLAGLTVWVTFFRPGKIEGAWNLDLGLRHYTDSNAFIYFGNGHVLGFQEGGVVLNGHYHEVGTGSYSVNWDGNEYFVDVRGIQANVRDLAELKFDRELNFIWVDQLMRAPTNQKLKNALFFVVLGDESVYRPFSPDDTVTMLEFVSMIESYGSNWGDALVIFSDDSLPGVLLRALESNAVQYRVYPTRYREVDYLLNESEPGAVRFR